MQTDIQEPTGLSKTQNHIISRIAYPELADFLVFFNKQSYIGVLHTIPCSHHISIINWGVSVDADVTGDNWGKSDLCRRCERKR